MSHGHDPNPATVPAGLQHGGLLENRVFGFWVFLAGEATLFASLIGTYLALVGQYNHGKTPQELFNLTLIGIATVTLLSSSLTGVLATVEMQRGNLRGLRFWLGFTIVLGAIFLGIQVSEFYTYYHEGFRLSTSAYSSGFYSLVGFHGAHVTFGVFWLLGLLVQTYRLRRIEADMASRLYVAGLYWHFVDVVWVLIFTVVYLLGKAG